MICTWWAWVKLIEELIIWLKTKLCVMYYQYEGVNAGKAESYAYRLSATSGRDCALRTVNGDKAVREAHIRRDAVNTVHNERRDA